MMKRSAGILPYKIIDNKLYVYLEHPGGPYLSSINKWSICKGEYEKNENALTAALREFEEETSFKINKDKLFFLASEKQSNNKLITIFAINQDIDPKLMKSNTFTIEYPKNSGKFQEFPEMDKASWFEIDEAIKVVFKGQIKVLEKLKDKYINNIL